MLIYIYLNLYEWILISSTHLQNMKFQTPLNCAVFPRKCDSWSVFAVY